MKLCIAVLCLALAFPALAQVSPPAPKPAAKAAKVDCPTDKKPRKPSRENARS